MFIDDDDVAVLTWNDREYLIKRRDFNNADILRMPDGTLLNARKMGIDTDKRLPKRYQHRIIAADDAGIASGHLPILTVQIPQLVQETVN